MASESKLGSAYVEVTAKLDKLDQDLAGAKAKTEQTTNNISSKFGAIKWAAVGAGAATLTGALSDLAREGAQDEARMEALRVATENTGTSWDDAAGKADAFITMMRDSRAIADDELVPAMASLTSVTQDYDKAQQLSMLAADLARGKNMSYASAAELVGKVAEGNVSMLKRYGITLDENATSEEALAELQKRFAGQAENYGKTASGQMDIMNAKIGDFREQIGQATGPAMDFVGMLPGMSAGFSIAGGAVGGLGKMFPGFSSGIMTTVVPALGSMNLALGPIGIAILAIAAVIGVLALAWTQNWGDIQGKVQAVWAFIEPIFGNFTTTLGNIWTTVQNVCGWIGDAFGNLGTTIGLAWDGITGGVKASINTIIGFVNSLLGAWNAIELRIPGFNVEIPRVDLPPPIGTIGGGTLGWEGLTVGTPDVPLIPTLDTGAIVTQPTLAALAMNNRAEAVIPLDRLGPAGGTVYDQRQMNVNIQGAQAEDTGNRFVNDPRVMRWYQPRPVF